MGNLLEKIITIKEPTNLNPEDRKPVKFKDQEDNKYILWKSNKDGETMVYRKFKELPYNGDGAEVGIAYAEEQKSFTNDKGKDITFTQRTVVVLKNPNEIINSAPASKPQPTYHKEPKNDGINWDKINEEKEKSMRWMNALNNACLLIANGKGEDIKTIAEKIYGLKRPMDIKDKVAEAGWDNQEQPAPPEEDGGISVEQVPF